MVGKKQDVNVAVTDNGTQGGQRSWTVKIEAGAAPFLLSDTLAKEGAIKSFDIALRGANRTAIAAYISAGRKLIKEVGSRGKKVKAAV